MLFWATAVDPECHQSKLDGRMCSPVRKLWHIGRNILETGMVRWWIKARLYLMHLIQLNIKNESLIPIIYYIYTLLLTAFSVPVRITPMSVLLCPIVSMPPEFVATSNCFNNLHWLKSKNGLVLFKCNHLIILDSHISRGMDIPGKVWWSSDECKISVFSHTTCCYCSNIFRIFSSENQHRV